MADKIFCHFHPPDEPVNQNFEKLKEIPGNIILHMGTINENCMMDGSWDMECGRHNFFVILDGFLPFYPPPNNPENQNFGKMEKFLEILWFYTCVP